MIQKILLWIVVAWIGLFILTQILAWLPAILLVIGGGIAICCLYALLPDGLRLPAIENWLGTSSYTPAASLPNSPQTSSPPDSSDAPSSGESTKSSTPPAAPVQPQLDFSKIIPRTGGKLPDRDELVAKIRAKVIGQDLAIETLTRVLLGKLAAQNSPKPLVILLPGPTGTGKTEISKALAEALDTKLVRFDMGEFAEAFKASNLFGSAVGYVGSSDGGALPNAIRHSKKRCVILFDEVEKAHSTLWPQMLAFFDEGRVSDTLGSVTAPKDTICLLTSNLQAEKIGENPAAAKEILKEGRYFPPEFLGRIDKIIPLLRLSPADTARLTVVLAKRWASRYGLSLIIEQEALEELVSATFDEAERYGGRGITEKISDLLTDDFIDLQSARVAEARLIVHGDRLRAVSSESLLRSVE